MILDCHIHIMGEGKAAHAGLRKRLQEAKINGGSIFSEPPPSFQVLGKPLSPEDRLDALFECTNNDPLLFPFYWIDPLEKGAMKQVDLAMSRKVRGFKVICNHFYPCDKKAMPIFHRISEAKRPILFHSGILWDGMDSSRYNRPVGFESLIDVPGLRFALAHIGWPWCDELIAVFGKFLSAKRRKGDSAAEMFIDFTPGTPPIYREEALRKVFTVGYPVANNVMFGSDCCANDYNCEHASKWIQRDTAIYRKLKIPKATMNAVFGGNLKRFIGIE